MIFLEGQKRIKANIIKRVTKEILMRNDRAKLPGGSKIASRSGINMPPSQEAANLACVSDEPNSDHD